MTCSSIINHGQQLSISIHVKFEFEYNPFRYCSIVEFFEIWRKKTLNGKNKCSFLLLFACSLSGIEIECI